MTELEKVAHLPKDLSGYSDFNYYSTQTMLADEGIVEDFVEKNKEALKEILVVELKNDMDISKKQKAILPDAVGRYLSWYENITYYTLKGLKDNEEFQSTFVWWGRWTTAHTVDWLMKKIIQTPELQNIVSRITVSLKEIYKESVLKKLQEEEK